MKSSKHVETCFVRANNDFDDKLTAFSMKKKDFGQKSPKTDTVVHLQNETLLNNEVTCMQCKKKVPLSTYF